MLNFALWINVSIIILPVILLFALVREKVKRLRAEVGILIACTLLSLIFLRTHFVIAGYAFIEFLFIWLLIMPLEFVTELIKKVFINILYKKYGVIEIPSLSERESVLDREIIDEASIKDHILLLKGLAKMESGPVQLFYDNPEDEANLRAFINEFDETKEEQDLVFYFNLKSE